MTPVAVYPLVPARSFDEPLTYDDPLGGHEPLKVGQLVEVPVGPALRAGVVAATDVAAPEGVTLKPVTRVVELPALPPDLVALAVWVAEQYGCAVTRALALVVPPKLAAHARAAAVPTRRRVQAVRRITDVVPEGLSSRLAALVGQLPQQWTAAVDVERALGTTRASLTKLAAAQVVELEQRFVDELEAAPSEAGGSTGPTIVGTESDTQNESSGPASAAVRQGVPVDLTPAQVEALKVCQQGTPDDPATLLVGITGSGKTEVYLELIARSLQQGRGAIVLVPEIALTPQTARRFTTRFPAGVEVLHSNLTRGQRQQAYERLAVHPAPLVVGPRSAIFAPVRNLGVIVIDEEHDSSYKQESEPRYDARRVAYRRAQLQGALLVYGSATPRAESWHGIRRRARLRERAAGGQLAPVELVDLRDHGDAFPITEPVQIALDATLRRGRKAIVLHNRRGYATALHCRTCGHSFRCPNCDVTLVVHGTHASRQSFACHHCGFGAPVPKQCPDCGAADIARMGAGSERIERDLAERFGVPVFRLDADAAAQNPGGVAEILREFAAADASILTGTQMVAKGHDFPDVELAVVIEADTALAIPDFRAEERAFSLVAQLAGRAGRSAATAEQARVLVQSWDPESEFLRFAQHHDVEGFLTEELARRQVHGYPPYSRLVRVLISAPDDTRVNRWARLLGENLRSMESGAVLGPAPLMRIANRQRAQLVVKTRSPAPIALAMRGFLRKSAAKRTRDDVRITLDVDPQSLI